MPVTNGLDHYGVITWLCFSPHSIQTPLAPRNRLRYRWRRDADYDDSGGAAEREKAKAAKKSLHRLDIAQRGTDDALLHNFSSST